MTHSLAVIVSQLRLMNVQLKAQAVEIASLRAAADIQFTRIADMQAELDVLPTARERREEVRVLRRPPDSAGNHNGNGRSE